MTSENIIRTSITINAKSLFIITHTSFYIADIFYLFCIFISFFISFVSVYIIVVIFTRRFIRSIFFHIVVFHIVSHVISVIEKFIFHIIIFRSDILLIGW